MQPAEPAHPRLDQGSCGRSGLFPGGLQPLRQQAMRPDAEGPTRRPVVNGRGSATSANECAQRANPSATSLIYGEVTVRRVTLAHRTTSLQKRSCCTKKKGQRVLGPAPAELAGAGRLCAWAGGACSRDFSVQPPCPRVRLRSARPARSPNRGHDWTPVSDRTATQGRKDKP